MKKIEDLLQQATRELFLRGSRCMVQVAENREALRVRLRILTGFRDRWFEVLYSASDVCTKKGDGLQEIFSPITLEIEEVDYVDAWKKMLQMTEHWGKYMHERDSVKVPFHFYDEVTRQVIYPQNMLAIMHLCMLLGVYCGKGYITNIPFGADLFYRIQSLQTRCRQEMKNAFTV